MQGTRLQAEWSGYLNVHGELTSDKFLKASLNILVIQSGSLCEYHPIMIYNNNIKQTLKSDASA